MLSILCAAFLVVPSPALSLAPMEHEGEAREVLRELVASGRGVGVGDRIEPIYAVRPAFRFYQARDFVPAWDEVNRERLEIALDALALDGLPVAGYHREEIDSLTEVIEREPNALRLAARDILLTDAWLTAARHLLQGRVDPRSIGAEWFIERPERELAPLLTRALEKNDPAGGLDELRPVEPGYAKLREALAHYRSIEAAGGWDPLELGGSLKAGSAGPAVEALRRRLAMTHDLSVPGGADVFDVELRLAVLRFQRRHGLTDDGIVGPATLAALNEPVSARIDRIIANLERWRWLPRDLGDDYVLVNLAGFSLHVVERGVEIMSMRVVAGRLYRRTPVLSSSLSHVVFNPTWSVPPIIAATDLLEKVKKDRGYFARNGIRVFAGNREIDPATVAWSRLSESNFPYQLRQDPGPQNALGRVKFVFPNRFNVYLHDSPDRDLFSRESRDFSSGCIRVERPLDLANHLMGGSAGARIRAALATRREQTISLPREIPVHLLYWTAWVDRDGVVQFRPDVYHRDERLLNALRAPAPERR